MHGLRNSYALIEDLEKSLESKYPQLARALSDKSYGIDSDGMLVVQSGNRTRYRMRVFNPDGSEAEMCRNGIKDVYEISLEEDVSKNSLSGLLKKATHVKICQIGKNTNPSPGYSGSYQVCL